MYPTKVEKAARFYSKKFLLGIPISYYSYFKLQNLQLCQTGSMVQSIRNYSCISVFIRLGQLLCKSLI